MPAFTADFLKRHQDKLLFGSDCSCADGHGGGVSQSNNPAAARMAGKCVARETLGLLKRSTSPDVFQKIVWGNAAQAAEVTFQHQEVQWNARPPTISTRSC